MPRVIYPESLFSGARLITVLMPKLKLPRDIRVRCPKCGEVGVLRIRKKDGGVSLYVYHGRGVSHSVTRIFKNVIQTPPSSFSSSSS